jgi:serine protease Do
MPFPIEPNPGDDPSQFLIQDPFGLRKQVLPLLDIDRDTGLLTGLGTCLKADPFLTFLTAEHVLDGQFAEPAEDRTSVVAALFGIGLVYGRVGLPSEYFAPVSHVFSWRRLQEEPPALIGSTPPRRFVADVMRFHVDASNVPDTTEIPPLPIRLSGAAPSIGDRVLAVGYPDLPRMRDHPADTVAITYVEGMYGAEGRITGIHPAGRGSTYPWPQLEVEADWRPGMSGGPVFNEAGEVIGIVSTSLPPGEGCPGIGYATDLSRVGLEYMIPSLDRSNPGNFLGHAVLRPAPWHLAGFFPDQVQAEAHCLSLGDDYVVRYGSHRYGTDDFLYSEPA